MTTNAEMEYRRADSMTISIAIHGLRLAPGMRDTTRIRMTISTDDSTVVTTDSVYALSGIAFQMLAGKTCELILKPKNVIPVAKTVYQTICPPRADHVPIDTRLQTRGMIAALQLLSHRIQHLQTFWIEDDQYSLQEVIDRVLTIMLSAMDSLKVPARLVVDPAMRSEWLPWNWRASNACSVVLP
jgi:hypothetical protein